MAKKRERSKLFRLVSSKRMRDKLHPRIEREDRYHADGSRKRIRQNEFTDDGFPWGSHNMGEVT